MAVGSFGGMEMQNEEAVGEKETELRFHPVEILMILLRCQFPGCVRVSQGRGQGGRGRAPALTPPNERGLGVYRSRNMIGQERRHFAAALGLRNE